MPASPIISSEVKYKFNLFSPAENEDVITILDDLTRNRTSTLKEKVCIISVVGKSCLGSHCKAALIDEALGTNVFRGLFGQSQTLFSENGCKIEGYFDSRNSVIFMHLNSILDSDVLEKTSKMSEKDLVEKGFLQMWPDMQLVVARALLLLFHISHIVLFVNPTPHFDLSFVNLFRILDIARQKAQPFVREVLEAFPNLPSDWTHGGRICSPRVLLVMEDYNRNIPREEVEKWERQLEGQIYRILRRSRVITNVSSNSIFAISSHDDFVFITQRTSTIRDPKKFLLDQLIQFCNGNEESDNATSEPSLYDFLWNHVTIALTKGFDDNLGRHAAPPIFELPTVKEFLEVIGPLRDLFFPTDAENSPLKAVFNSIHNALNIDVRFSKARCAKVMPIAMSIYQEQLPAHYNQDLHDRRLSNALQHFTIQARGPALYDYAQQLKDECDLYWQSEGHQVCDMMTLTGNPLNPSLHRLKLEDESEEDEDVSDKEEGATASKKPLPFNSRRGSGGRVKVIASDRRHRGEKEIREEKEFDFKKALRGHGLVMDGGGWPALGATAAVGKDSGEADSVSQGDLHFESQPEGEYNTDLSQTDGNLASDLFRKATILSSKDGSVAAAMDAELKTDTEKDAEGGERDTPGFLRLVERRDLLREQSDQLQ